MYAPRDRIIIGRSIHFARARGQQVQALAAGRLGTSAEGDRKSEGSIEEDEAREKIKGDGSEAVIRRGRGDTRFPRERGKVKGETDQSHSWIRGCRLGPPGPHRREREREEGKVEASPPPARAK